MDVARADGVALTEFLMASAEEERWSGGRAGYLQRRLPFSDACLSEIDLCGVSLCWCLCVTMWCPLSLTLPIGVASEIGSFISSPSVG